MDWIPPEATRLVASLPVGLQEEVADEMGDDENDEDLHPAQCRCPAIALIPAGYATGRAVGQLDK